MRNPSSTRYLLAVGRDFPTIVCLCGSTRFSTAFRTANFHETLAGKIVLSIGCDFKSDEGLGLTEADKVRLDTLHLRKIDIADEILVLNVGDYIGASTGNEIQYARTRGIPIRWLELHQCRDHHCPCGTATPKVDAFNKTNSVQKRKGQDMNRQNEKPTLDDVIREAAALGFTLVVDSGVIDLDKAGEVNIGGTFTGDMAIEQAYAYLRRHVHVTRNTSEAPKQQ